jgi:vacuolar-type H+-ATPase subunit I/STV1
MALADEDIAFIKAHLGEWLAEQSLAKPPAVYEIELRERMVRVEEELKHQRELMREGFERMDQRFEQVDRRFEQVDKRFEQADKRHDELRREMLARFEQADKRHDAMLKRHDAQFLWLIGFITTGVGVIIGVLKFL